MNTGNNGCKIMAIRRSLVLIIVVLAIFLIIACISSWSLHDDRRSMSESLQATAEAEAFLTEAYGAEVRSVIENFESQWHSLEAHIDPSIQAEVATGPYLDGFGYARRAEALYDEPFWWVTTSAAVQSVRVLEYSPERFKAVADVIEQVDETAPGGEFIQSRGSYQTCGVYVFVREDDTWELAGFFNASFPDYQRDWWYVQDWLKEIIGELPDRDPCGWIREGH